MSTTNRMVEKSKKAIKDALLELMYEKDFNSITVNDLLKKANISRGTFYAHYKNLENVRDHLVEDLYMHADNLLGDSKASDIADNPYEIILLAAQMMYQSRDPSKRLFKFINVYDLGSHLKDWLTKYILDDEIIVEKFGGFNAASSYARFISGGVTHAFNMWILDDFPVSPEQIAGALNNILMGGLNAALNSENK